MTRLLVVGLRPRPGDDEGDAQHAFTNPNGSSGRRLAELFGRWPHPSVRAVNLFQSWENGTPASARRVADVILAGVPEHRIVALGTQVRAAFGLEAWFDSDTVPGAGGHKHIVAIPHPSGRDRYWNVPERVVAARLFLARFGMIDIPSPDARRLLRAERRA